MIIDNLKLYQLQTLPSKDGLLPIMYARGHKERLVFHADLKKLISYWRFDINCLPSFLDKDIPIATFNPDVERDNSLRQKIFGYESEREKHDMDFKNSILEKDDYKKSACYEYCYDWLYLSKDKLDKGYTPMGMPIVDMLDLKKYTIETLKRRKFLCFQYDERFELASSDSCVAFQDGRHRTRFLEFLGAKDIFILIRNEQYNWFHDNCSYIG